MSPEAHPGWIKPIGPIRLCQEGESVLTRVRCSVRSCVFHDGEECTRDEVRIGVQFTALSHDMLVNGLASGYPGTPYMTTICEDFAPRSVGS